MWKVSAQHARPVRRPIAAGAANGHQPIEVLLVEDSAPDAQLFADMLHDCWPGGVRITLARRLGEVPALIERSAPACIVSDLSLPDATGLEAIDAVQAIAPDTPLVVLTGHEDEEAAMTAVHEGAQEYLVKSHVNGFLLRRAIRSAMERKQVELLLQRQALHDPLTDLPNRALFRERLASALARATRADARLAVCFIDLDGFKQINDTLGHRAGDELLVEVAGRLRACVRPYDTVARFGGDEFLVLCDEVADVDAAEAIVHRIGEALCEPFAVVGRTVEVTPSVGVALSRRSSTPDRLMRDADAAMYEAKQSPGFAYEFSDAPRSAAGARAPALERELPEALGRGELALHYQPQVDLRTGDQVGMEALMRWTHPRLGAVAPGDFIPVAERTGAIGRLGRWAVEEACRHLAAVRAATGRDLGVSVNVSPFQLASGDFPADVARAVAAAGVPPQRVTLELSESASLTDDGAQDAIRRLLDAGVRLALDGFGTGYAPLGALAQLPFSQVKIDRSFVSGSPDGGTAERIVAGMASLAKSLELTVVAVGIETEEQRARVQRLGCDIGQGHLCGRPAPAAC